MAAPTTDFVTENFRQAADAFNRTLQAGVKFHEQTAQFWGDLFKRNSDELRSGAERVAGDAVPFARKNLDRFHQVFEEQAQRSLDLLRKSFDAAATQPGAMTPDKFMSLWQESFDTLRNSTDNLSKAHAEMYQNWTEWLRTMSPCCGEATKANPANGHTHQPARKADKAN